LVQSAFNIFKSRFETGELKFSDYDRLIDCAYLLGDKATAAKVTESKPKKRGDQIYESENLIKHSDTDNFIQNS